MHMQHGAIKQHHLEKPFYDISTRKIPHTKIAHTEIANTKIALIEKSPHRKLPTVKLARSDVSSQL